MERINLRVTVKSIKQMLDLLPDEMEVEVSPITGAWLGTSHKMRFGRTLDFYDKDGNEALPSDPGAYAVLNIFEDTDDAE